MLQIRDAIVCANAARKSAGPVGRGTLRWLGTIASRQRFEPENFPADAKLRLGCFPRSERPGGGFALCQEPAFECLRRHRPAEEIALPLLASHAHQEIGGCTVLDAFRDHRQTELRPERTQTRCL